MRLGLRLLFASFVITGVAGVFALQVLQREAETGARQAMADALADTARLLAVQVGADLRALPPAGSLQDSRLGQQLAAYGPGQVDGDNGADRQHEPDLRVRVTDAAGRVLLDAGFGAVSPALSASAAVRDGARVIGVVTVSKSLAALQSSSERGQRRSLVAGAWLLACALGLGALSTLWLRRALRRLKDWVTHVHAGQRLPVPPLPGELGELAVAVDEMRERLENREHLEHTVRALTHELQGPLTAIQGAAELLGDEQPDDDREGLVQQIQEQSQRLRDLAERMLALARLESQRAIALAQPVALLALVDEVATSHVPLAIQRGVGLVWEARTDVTLAGDPASLTLLFTNLWSNALDFAPEGTSIVVSLRRVGPEAVFTLRDTGPGVSDFALSQLGQRFFSQPRPRDGRRGSGLGLAIARQAAALHGGQIAFEPASPGLRVTVRLPA